VAPNNIDVSWAQARKAQQKNVAQPRKGRVSQQHGDGTTLEIPKQKLKLTGAAEGLECFNYYCGADRPEFKFSVICSQSLLIHEFKISGALSCKGFRNFQVVASIQVRLEHWFFVHSRPPKKLPCQRLELVLLHRSASWPDSCFVPSLLEFPGVPSRLNSLAFHVVHFLEYHTCWWLF
jgi:hypothetical protein